MLGEFEIGLHEIGYSEAPTTLTQDAIVFNGYSLQSTNVITSEIDYDNQKNIEFSTFKFPRVDGGGVLSKFYRGRTITLRGTIKGDFGGTAEDFNDLVDEFKKNMRHTEGNLDITVNSEIRRIKATLVNLELPKKHFNITFLDFVATFQTAEPLFYAITDQNETYTDKAADFTESFVHEGNGDVFPSFYFIFGTGTTATEVSITDPNGRILTITTAITNGTVIFVNGETRTVEKDGAQIDFSGSFPLFEPDVNTFQVDFTGTVLCDVTILAKKNYL